VDEAGVPPCDLVIWSWHLAARPSLSRVEGRDISRPRYAVTLGPLHPWKPAAYRLRRLSRSITGRVAERNLRVTGPGTFERSQGCGPFSRGRPACPIRAARRATVWLSRSADHGSAFTDREDERRFVPRRLRRNKQHRPFRSSRRALNTTKPPGCAGGIARASTGVLT